MLFLNKVLKSQSWIWFCVLFSKITFAAMFMLYFIYRPENPHHMEMFDQRVNASIQIEKEQQTKQKLLFSKFFVVFSCESFREGNEREKKPNRKNMCIRSTPPSYVLHFSFFSTQFINNACWAMHSTVFIRIWSTYIVYTQILCLSFCNNKSDRMAQHK